MFIRDLFCDKEESPCDVPSAEVKRITLSEALLLSSGKELTNNWKDKFEEVPIPSVLCDPIDLLIFQDPVMLPTGHCYSQHILDTLIINNRTCPFTGKAIVIEKIRPVPIEMIRILRELKNYQEKSLKEISETKDHDLSEMIIEYKQLLQSLAQRMNAICQRLITQGNIQAIKDNLKIDLTIEHINFWKRKGKNSSQIPHHIDLMMERASRTYETVDDFIRAINGARQINSCNAFFKRPFRDAETLAIYNAPDLRTFVVGHKGP